MFSTLNPLLKVSEGIFCEKRNQSLVIARIGSPTLLHQTRVSESLIRRTSGLNILTEFYAQRLFRFSKKETTKQKITKTETEGW